MAARVDKYGRKVSKTRNQDDLRRFYRLKDDEEAAAVDPSTGTSAPDYARGEGLVESSDEEADSGSHSEESDLDDEVDLKTITLGRDSSQFKPTEDDDEEDAFPEVNLDESNFEDLDAQASAYSKKYADETPGASSSKVAAAGKIYFSHRCRQSRLGPR